MSGHGVSAAFLTSAIKALLREYSGPMFSPEDTMRGVDKVMRRMLGEEQYLTACYALRKRRTKRLSVVSAGHLPMIISRVGGVIELVEMKSDPLGLFRSLVLQRQDLRMNTANRFYMYSDGLIELKWSRKRGLAVLQQACQECRNSEVLLAPARIISKVCEPARGISAQDDLLVMAVEVKA